MADKPITRRLKIYVNGQEVDATITNLRKNLVKFRAQANRAVEGTPEWKKYNKAVAETEAELNKAYKAQKAFREDVKLTENGIDATTKSLGDFTSSLTQYFNGLKSGNFLDIQQGFNGIKTGIKGATKAALAFIATPIGLAITALAGIGLAAKSWLDYNTQVVEALRLTQQITGLTDQAADQARIRAEALAETFDLDFKETLISAKNLAQQFGISFEEAFDVIEGQLVRGQKNNDEFFTSLKEYPTFFAQAGYSAEEFGKIIATGFDLGIYNDKLPDALKEADISLREQTKSTRDALVNAFGAAFTDSILTRVRKGEITTKEALEEISDQADKTGLNVQQNAQLTADLFRGAGEDAGGALKVFEAVNVALNQQQRELTESEKITQEQIKATTELKQVSSALFATGDQGFGLLIDKARLFGTKLLIQILKAGVDVYNWFVDLNNESRVFSGILKTIGVVATAPFKVIGEAISLVKNQFKSLGTIVEGIFTFDIDKIKQGFNQGLSNIGESISNLKDQAVEDAKAITDAFSGNNKLERKSLDDFIAEDTTPTTQNPTPTSGGQEQNKGLTPEDQKKLDSRKKLYEELKALQEEQELQDELKKIEKDQRDEEEEILRKEAEFEKLIEEAEGDAELQAGFEEQKQLAIQAIRDKYAEERLAKDQKEKEKQAKLDEKFKQEQIKAEEELANAKADAISTGIGLVQSLFDEQSAIFKALFIADKAFAAVDVFLKGQQERAAIAATYASIPGGQAIAAPLILASKLRTATSLASIAATVIGSFEEGGDTFYGPSTGGLDGRGGRLAVLHPEEYVIPKFVRKDPEVPAIINYLEAKRQKQLPSFESGGEFTDQPSTNTTPETNTANPLMLTEETGRRIVNRLENLKVFYTFEDELKRRDIEDKLTATENAAKS